MAQTISLRWNVCPSTSNDADLLSRRRQHLIGLFIFFPLTMQNDPLVHCTLTGGPQPTTTGARERAAAAKSPPPTRASVGCQLSREQTFRQNPLNLS